MITVQRKKGQITVSGHAGYAEKGHDIVCAAVSILIYNLQNSIERLTDDTVCFSFCSTESLKITCKKLKITVSK